MARRSIAMIEIREVLYQYHQGQNKDQKNGHFLMPKNANVPNALKYSFQTYLRQPQVKFGRFSKEELIECAIERGYLYNIPFFAR